MVGVALELNLLSDWGRCVDAFLWTKQIEGLSDESIVFYSRMLRYFVDFHVKSGLNCPSPATCHSEHVQLFLSNLQTKGRSQIYLHSAHSVLHNFFNWLVRQGIVEVNPVKSVPRPKVGLLLPRTVTEQHFATAVSLLDPNKFGELRLLAILFFAFDTGARLSEICELKVGDLDLIQRCCLVKGKGGKERIVFFGRRTAETLRKWLAVRTLVVGQPTPDEPVFCYRKGTPLDRTFVTKSWLKLQRRAGLKPLPFHGLRHGFARCWLLNGGDGFSLQRLLGHSNPKMTDRYVQLWGSDLQKLYSGRSPVDKLRIKV